MNETEHFLKNIIFGLIFKLIYCYNQKNENANRKFQRIASVSGSLSLKKEKDGRALAQYHPDDEIIIISLSILFAPKLWKQCVLWHEYAHHELAVFKELSNENEVLSEAEKEQILDIIEALANFYAYCKLKPRVFAQREVLNFLLR